MPGFGWLFIGAALGAAHGGLLWHSVQGLQPGASAHIRSAWVVLMGWARSVGVALALLPAVQRGLPAVLWAMLGLLLARYTWLRRAAYWEKQAWTVLRQG